MELGELAQTFRPFQTLEAILGAATPVMADFLHFADWHSANPTPQAEHLTSKSRATFFNRANWRKLGMSHFDSLAISLRFCFGRCTSSLLCTIEPGAPPKLLNTRGGVVPRKFL
jgi:hypothetical protein